MLLKQKKEKRIKLEVSALTFFLQELSASKKDADSFLHATMLFETVIPAIANDNMIHQWYPYQITSFG